MKVTDIFFNDYTDASDTDVTCYSTSVQFNTTDEDRLAKLWWDFCWDRCIIRAQGERDVLDAATSARLDRIKAHAVRRDEAAKAKAEAEATEAKRLSSQILAMGGRIKALMDLANECIDNDIEIGQTPNPWSDKDPNNFIASGITHKVGFMRPGRDKTINEIGIKNGGWNGDYDLVITDCAVLYRHEHWHDMARAGYGKTPAYIEPSIRDLKKFLDQFNDFEARFLKFIDSL